MQHLHHPNISQEAILLNDHVDEELCKLQSHLLTIFWVRLQMVWTVVSSFWFPHSLSTWSLFFFPRKLSSALMWLRSIHGVPLGLLVTTILTAVNISGVLSLIAKNGLHFHNRCGKESSYFFPFDPYNFIFSLLISCFDHSKILAISVENFLFLHCRYLRLFFVEKMAIMW